MVDALDTAADHKIEPRVGGIAIRAGRLVKAPDVYRAERFESLIERWVPLTLTLNDINRSMGHGDFYPFVIPEVAVSKLAFVHRIVRQAAS